MSTSQQQINFLKSLEDFLPENISLVNEIAETLEISNDSAYRRIRGETTLTFDEISLLCRKYQLSFDEFNGMSQQRMVTFNYQTVDDNASHMETYFRGLHEEISIIQKANTEDKHVLFAGQGIPIFHYLKFPGLTAFKMFYWMKSIMNVTDFQTVSFKPALIPDELIQLGNEIFQSYVHIPSTEIWTDTTVLGTIHQLQFYWDSGAFESQEDALLLIEEMRELLQYVQQAAAGAKKQDDYENPTQYGAKLNLYYSEIEFENNCIIVRCGDQQKVYLGQFSFGTLVTQNDQYFHVTESWLNNILKKSNLISGHSDTMRFQFFKRALKHLDRLKNKVEND